MTAPRHLGINAVFLEPRFGGLAAPTRLKAAAARKDRRAGGPPADSAGPESAAA